MALLNRLENDRTLARFSGQFVPLKIVTDNNPQWAQWSRLYPIDGNGIPRLYVIRADGQKLFGDVGSLPGDQLPTMLLAALKQAGRTFSDADAANLDQAVTLAKSHLEAGDLLASAASLSSVLPFGSPDEIPSYAEPVRIAGEVYEQLLAGFEKSVKQAETELSESTGQPVPWTQVIAICEAEAAYEMFPKLKPQAIALARQWKQQEAFSESFAQADSLIKARTLKLSANPRLRSRAATAYAAVIRRYPDTEVDTLARRELAEIEPDAKVLQSESSSPPPGDGFRLWTARTGNFSTTAKFLQQKSGKVQLQKEDGTKIVVEISALSDEDQAYLQDR